MEQNIKYRLRFAVGFLLVMAIGMMGIATQVASQAIDTTEPVATTKSLNPVSDVYRFAVVDFSQLLDQAPQAQAVTQRLEIRFSARESELAQEKLQLENAQQNLALSSEDLSPEALIQSERDLRSRRRAYFRKLEDYREEVSIARNNSLQEIQDAIDHAIESVREQQNIDLVLRESQYMVASKRINITQDVLAYLEQQFQQQRDAVMLKPAEN